MRVRAGRGMITDGDLLAIALSARGSQDGDNIGIPVMVHFKPGSDIKAVDKVATSLGKEVTEFDLGTVDPTDIRGLPQVDSQETETFHMIPSKKLQEGLNRKNVIHFSNVQDGYKANIHAALQNLVERRLGEVGTPDSPAVFSEETTGILAMSLNDINLSLKTRMAHIDFQSNDGNMRKISDGELKKLRDNKERWQNYYALAEAIVSDYFRRNRGDSFKMSDMSEREEDKAQLLYTEVAVPSPRTYSFLIPLLAEALYLELDKASLLKLSSGCIGNYQGAKFMDYLENRQFPSIEDILDKPGVIGFEEYNPEDVAVSLAAAARVVTERDFGILDAAVDRYNTTKWKTGTVDILPMCEVLTRRLAMSMKQKQSLPLRLANQVRNMKLKFYNSKGLGIA